MIRRRFPKHVVLGAFVAAGGLWELWTTVPRPERVLSQFTDRYGCPRPMPQRVHAPPALDEVERCALVQAAFRFPVHAGVVDDVGLIRDVWIFEEVHSIGLKAPLWRRVWRIEIWLRPEAGPETIWYLTVDQHSGRRKLLFPR